MIVLHAGCTEGTGVTELAAEDSSPAATGKEACESILARADVSSSAEKITWQEAALCVQGDSHDLLVGGLERLDSVILHIESLVESGDNLQAPCEDPGAKYTTDVSEDVVEIAVFRCNAAYLLTLECGDKDESDLCSNTEAAREIAEAMFDSM